MLNKYHSVVKENILSMKLSSSEEDLKDLDDFITYLKDRTAIAGLEKWGGLFTVKRKKQTNIFGCVSLRKKQRIL